ncbi:sodium- and chloride-dependent glycine transporter 2 [Culicoides brevitarsis]|uniref:sodium- and chloride-dependent glycine transporter 2 n=1 Tax=Culicoides brevitarsis TaxID=469753 RepID=UPI00307C01DA
MVVVDREKWTSKAEFILSSLGYCVGMGNVWRFPYLCYRGGGGAFLVPYLSMLFFCGVPLYLLETSLGQFSSLSAMSIFKTMAPALKGCGYAILIVNFIVTMQYNLLIAYPILFLWECFKNAVPWKSCGNSWNTEKCVVVNQENASSIFALNENLTQAEKYKTAADEFFHNQILDISADPNIVGDLNWPVLVVNMLSWIVLFLCVIKGVKSVGKVVYISATFPYLILSILFIRGITLPGAWEGIKFYIVPQWDKLLNLEVWADAACQIFFSIGPGWGGIINMASYNKFDNNLKTDSTFLPIVNCGTSIFAGFVVFSVLGYLSDRTGLPIENVATGGPSLAFVMYPEAIALLPYANFFAISFFLMLYSLGLDSCFVQIETIITCITDEWPNLRKNKHIVAFVTVFLMAVGSLMFVFQNGMYLIQVIDWYSSPLTIILVCFCEIVMVSYCYGLGNIVRDIEYMLGIRLSIWWKICWKIVNPLVLIFIFATVLKYNTKVTYNGVDFPDWAIALGWMSSMMSLLVIPGYFVYKIWTTKGSFIKRSTMCLMAHDWGPADPITRREYQAYKNKII